MLHSLHFDIPVFTKTCGAFVVGVDRTVGDLRIGDGETCCGATSALPVELVIRSASSMLCLFKMTLRAGSERRNAISAGKSGRMSIGWDVDELDDIETLLLRGLLERRLGEGVSGGLPGSEGAQTICSGVIDSPLTDIFSFPSIIASNSIR